MDARQVRLVDVDLGAHVVEVGHADQVARAGEAARHRDLAHLLELGEDHAVARRAQDGVVELDLRERDLGLELGDAGAVDRLLVLLLLELLGGDDAAPMEPLGAPELARVHRQVGTRGRERGLGPIEAGAVVAIVDRNQRIADMDRLALVGEVALDAAGDADADRDVLLAGHDVAGAGQDRAPHRRLAAVDDRRRDLHLGHAGGDDARDDPRDDEDRPRPRRPSATAGGAAPGDPRRCDRCGANANRRLSSRLLAL